MAISIPHLQGHIYSPPGNFNNSKSHAILILTKERTKVAYKTIYIIDTREIIRRYRAGQTIRSTASTMEYDRKTVREYINQSQAKGMLDSRLWGVLIFLLIRRSTQLPYARKAARHSTYLNHQSLSPIGPLSSPILSWPTLSWTSLLTVLIKS